MTFFKITMLPKIQHVNGLNIIFRKFLNCSKIPTGPVGTHLQNYKFKGKRSFQMTLTSLVKLKISQSVF